MIIIKREEIIANLISNINFACKERNMSINEFCRQCNVHKSVMDNLKRNCIPAVDKLANIAIFLNISVDELIGLTEQVRRNCAIIAQFEEK
ncbi:helix-turn-helix domain-containing protein [Ruminococcus sp.]|uniref:helix-turn-helix domain-containing protein n=1 Tax=Ruminococcus sp. TaxID=41978 RepID=UPI0025EA3C13|nr:helix-turn-helix domain-containing protein [Ruminococcus sp.]MBQ6252466.1 helix-turn-helix transcriptional regulator [Ruminococcus sp.]